MEMETQRERARAERLRRGLRAQQAAILWPIALVAILGLATAMLYFK